MFSVFMDNEYLTQYKELINSATSRIADPIAGYERHHIIPKSIGGGECSTNLVLLTPSEHVTAHFLLTAITEGTEKAKMSFAYWMMINVENIHQSRKLGLTPEQVEEAKQIRKNIKILQKTRDLIGQSRKGKVAVFNQTLDVMKYIDPLDINLYESSGYIKAGRPKSESQKKNISKTNKEKGIIPKSIGWNTGLTKETSESVAKVSASLKGNVPWNKGKSGTGFGNPSTNPMKNPEKIQKMLDTRRRNKQNNDNS